MQQYRTKSGDRLDQVCGQYYGHQTGAVEAVLEANRGLAEHGPMLPAGLLISLPDLPTNTVSQTLVRLWD